MTMPLEQTPKQTVPSPMGRHPDEATFVFICKDESMMNREKEESEWNNVTIIRENDVLMGRGSRSNQPGNVKFRQLIKDNRFRYLAASKVGKPKISEEVVKQWRSLNPPGRFLSRKDEDEVEGNQNKKDDHAVWFDVGDKKARLKTSMALRERTPEAVQYLQLIRKQENEETQRTGMLVRQQLGMDEQHHNSAPTFFPTEQTMQHPNTLCDASRRASFAGFSQHHTKCGIQHNSFQQQRYPSLHQHAMHTAVGSAGGLILTPLPSRRSSMMGERQAQLYMMQQQVQAQQRRIEMEMCTPSISGHHLPSIPDQTESDHSVDEARVSQSLPSQNVTSVVSTQVLAMTNNDIRQDITSSMHSLDTSLDGMDQPAHKTPDPKTPSLVALMAPTQATEFEDDAEDSLAMENYRSLLQGWAESQQKDTRSSFCSIFSSSDADDDMESIVKTPTRRKGVGRSMSGCSVQSTLSDLMAMSIISTGTEDDPLTIERAVLPDMVYFDD